MLEAAGREVRLSNPAKVYFPRPGWTKLDVATYYLEVADAALIHVRERPTVLKRFVDGITADPIWQKRVPKNIPEWLQTATVCVPLRPHRRGARGQRRGAPGVGGQPRRHRLQPVARAARRPGPPGRAARRPGPDATGVGWDEVRRTALVVRDVLEEHGLRGYPKTSGSKGIHVNVRIEPEWETIEVRRAALALAREVERRAPDLATSKWWKEERHGVFVDYNQNARDRTVASCYSVRPTPDARVSCALAWDEVADAEPQDLRLDTVPARLRTVGDPAADIDLNAGVARRAARPRAPRRGGRARRRAVAAALPQAARASPSACSRAATATARRSAAAPATRSPAARRPASRGGLQRGFGSKPRTGQGHAQEFDD